ncbi:hypothetical protein OJ998_28765 [Solirubrobacter taibaiensis]|nr:hypothetical protein [Solirubrobacter taibaiensis]
MWPRALALIGSAALLASLFLPWYELDVATGWVIYVGGDVGLDPWSLFTVEDVVLATIAFATPVIAFRRPALTPVLGALALAVVVFRLIVLPDGETLTLAPAAGLAVAGAVAICAPWLRFVAPLLLIASLWMPWFAAAPVPEVGNLAAPQLAVELGGGPGASWFAWDPYWFTAIAIAVLALVALRWRWVAAVAALLVSVWIVFPPDGLEPRTGAFIALGAALLSSFAPREKTASAPAA